MNNIKTYLLLFSSIFTIFASNQKLLWAIPSKANKIESPKLQLLKEIKVQQIEKYVSHIVFKSSIISYRDNYLVLCGNEPGLSDLTFIINSNEGFNISNMSLLMNDLSDIYYWGEFKCISSKKVNDGIHLSFLFESKIVSNMGSIRRLTKPYVIRFEDNSLKSIEIGLEKEEN